LHFFVARERKKTQISRLEGVERLPLSHLEAITDAQQIVIELCDVLNLIRDRDLETKCDSGRLEHITELLFSRNMTIDDIESTHWFHWSPQGSASRS
jgi:hypothetical protein